MASNPPDAETERRWREQLLAQRRHKEGLSFYLDIPESVEHDIWKRGFQAGSASQYGESSRTGVSTPSQKTDEDLKPEPFTTAPQTTIQNHKGATKRTINMYSDKYEKWVELTARFDSGTPDNWMTKDVVDLLDHAIITVPLERYQTFTGQVMVSSELVRSVLWHGDSASTRSRSTDFRVIRKPAPFEVLFGSNFLFSESVYSFNEPNLILTKLKETPENKNARERNRAIADGQAKEILEERKLLEAQPPSKKRSRTERQVTEKEKERKR